MPYYTFTIPKKSGGTRTITAPDPELKAKQKELLKGMRRLPAFWVSKKAHGFARKRSILTNARIHTGKKWILNLDIEDFFPSITRSRTLGHYKLGGDLDLAFHNGSLPQGAPTSPFLSNIYMRDFDTTIVVLVRKYVSDDIEYTRYADDLTFSSNSYALEKVPLFVRTKLNTLDLKLNNKKTRLAGPGQRQEVTGLNINSGRPTIPKKYRRKVRAITHRVSVGWSITEKQKAKLLGMISHISLCHPEEALKYRNILLQGDIKVVSDNPRKLHHVKRITLDQKANKTKHHTNPASKPATSKPAVSRKIHKCT